MQQSDPMGGSTPGGSIPGGVNPLDPITPPQPAGDVNAGNGMGVPPAGGVMETPAAPVITPDPSGTGTESSGNPTGTPGTTGV